jgi:hypothetical protein
MLKRVFAVCTLVLLAMGAAPVRAQEDGQPAVYSYIAAWAVPREQWRDFEKADADERSAMDKLVADGTIISYAEFNNLLHQEGQPTHGSWFTATSREGLLKALATLYKLPQTTFPARSAAKHWDYLTVSRMYGMTSGKFQGGYMAESTFQMEPGKTEAFFDMTKKHVVPIMEKLKSDGVVVLYWVDMEDFHSDTPGAVMFGYVTADAAGIDKVSDAIDAEFGSKPALRGAFESFVSMKDHHDFLGRVSTLVNK